MTFTNNQKLFIGKNSVLLLILLVSNGYWYKENSDLKQEIKENRVSIQALEQSVKKLEVERAYTFKSGKLTFGL